MHALLVGRTEKLGNVNWEVAQEYNGGWKFPESEWGSANAQPQLSRVMVIRTTRIGGSPFGPSRYFT